MELVIASTDMAKIRELRTLLEAFKSFDVCTLRAFGDYTPPDVIGDDCGDDAVLLATHAARSLDRWVIADSSGLVIPALSTGGSDRCRPYRGTLATEAESRQSLLSAMKHMDSAGRNAYFICSLALAGPKGLKKCATATCEGYILFEERGHDGSGFEPLFAKHDYDKSFAEIGINIKNRISHRRKAFDKLAPTLETLSE